MFFIYPSKSVAKSVQITYTVHMVFMVLSRYVYYGMGFFVRLALPDLLQDCITGK